MFPLWVPFNGCLGFMSVWSPQGDVTRYDSQRGFLAQHSVAMREQCNHSKQCRNNTATLCWAKNRRCESSRVISPSVCAAVLSPSLSVAALPVSTTLHFGFSMATKSAGCSLTLLNNHLQRLLQLLGQSTSFCTIQENCLHISLSPRSHWYGLPYQSQHHEHPPQVLSASLGVLLSFPFLATTLQGTWTRYLLNLLPRNHYISTLLGTDTETCLCGIDG